VRLYTFLILMLIWLSFYKLIVSRVLRWKLSIEMTVVVFFILFIVSMLCALVFV
jgi:hypothetical protein